MPRNPSSKDVPHRFELVFDRRMRLLLGGLDALDDLGFNFVQSGRFRRGLLSRASLTSEVFELQVGCDPGSRLDQGSAVCWPSGRVVFSKRLQSGEKAQSFSQCVPAATKRRNSEQI